MNAIEAVAAASERAADQEFTQLSEGPTQMQEWEVMTLCHVMTEKGGSFARSFAHTLALADQQNRDALLGALPGLVSRYKAMAGLQT